MIFEKIKDERIKEEVEFWVFTSKHVLRQLEQTNILSTLQKKGIKVFTDTCMVVSPAIKSRFNTIATNSTKAVFYLTKGKQNTVLFESVDKILEWVKKWKNVKLGQL